MKSADIAALIANPKTPQATRAALIRQMHGPASATAEPPAVKIPRGMNSWEKQYAGWLATMQAGGEVLWWAFEPIRVRLADNSFFKPDFLVVWHDGEITADEIKGVEREAAIVRWKVAAGLIPWVTFRMLTKEGSGWKVTRKISATVQIAREV